MGSQPTCGSHFFRLNQLGLRILADCVALLVIFCLLISKVLSNHDFQPFPGNIATVLFFFQFLAFLLSTLVASLI
jgi:hypothetical protein